MPKNNELGIIWNELLGKLTDDEREDFSELLKEKGLVQFEATDRILEFYEWTVKSNGSPVSIFCDPEDGLYLYAIRKTTDDLKDLLSITFESVK